MSERTYRLLLWALALTGLALDQASKYGVFAWLHDVEGNTHVLFRAADGKGFQLVAQFETRQDNGAQVLDAAGRPVPHVNQGALFGLGRDHKALANGAFAVISLLAAAAIIYWSTQKNTARDRWLCAALGLILAGTLGNLYDRVVFNGVRDFLHWNYLFDWPVFNVADCCLVTGACLLLVQAFLAPAPKAADPGAVAQTAEAALSNPAPVAAVGCAGIPTATERDGAWGFV